MNALTDLDIRLLRSFVTVADELHFTRAAARLYVAQQALSRDIRRLEDELGTQLFVRTTRRVTLTAEGERLLAGARELVALHDRLLAEVRTPVRPVVVDILSEGRLTGSRILELARAAEPEVEYRSRYGGGMGGAIGALLRAEIDVAFGRAHWLGQERLGSLDRRLVRLEPLGLLLPAGHPLAELDPVPVARLDGVEIDANPARDDAHEWIDLVRQFLALSGARPTGPHLAALGPDDQAHHLVRQGLPILTAVDHLPVAGGVIRALSDPIPVYPWSIVVRRGPRSAGISALEDGAAWLAREEGWLEAPLGAWIPEPELSLLAGTELPRVTSSSRRR